MKIIFSRKGFDSDNGGMASAFVENGEMVSFPIPASNRADLIRYADIRAEGMSMQERIEQLCQGEGTIFSAQHCHHDPDLVGDSRIRSSLREWTGAFGQSGGDNTRLKSASVGVGDLFLFFGWFKRAEQTDRGLHFVKKASEQHALFGYMQIGKMWEAKDVKSIPECFNDHPHMLRRRLFPDGKWPKSDTLYVAQKYLKIPGVAEGYLEIPGRGKCPGFGVFRHSPELVLTAKRGDADKYEPRSFWRLPEFFDGSFCTNNIRRIKEDGPRKELCDTGGIWQECVADAVAKTGSESQQNRIQEWALERIRIGMRID